MSYQPLLWDISAPVHASSPVYPGATPYEQRWDARIGPDSAVNLSLKVWTPPGDWQDVRSDLIERIKRDFEREGLSFPYPHQVAVRAPDRAPRPARGAPPNEAQPARPQ